MGAGEYEGETAIRAGRRPAPAVPPPLDRKKSLPSGLPVSQKSISRPDRCEDGFHRHAEPALTNATTEDIRGWNRFRLMDVGLHGASDFGQSLFRSDLVSFDPGDKEAGRCRSRWACGRRLIASSVVDTPWHPQGDARWHEVRQPGPRAYHRALCHSGYPCSRIPAVGGVRGRAVISKLPVARAPDLDGSVFSPHMTFLQQVGDYIWHITLPVLPPPSRPYATLTALTRISFLNEIQEAIRH